MINRKLYKTVLNKNGGTRTDYYLIKTHIAAEDVQGISYGVEIRQVPLDTFSLCPYLTANAPDISSNLKLVCDFLEDISSGDVDPVSLFDIIEDKFSEGNFKPRS